MVCFSGHALVFKLFKTPLLLILSQEKWLKRIFEAQVLHVYWTLCMKGLHVLKDFMYESTP